MNYVNIAFPFLRLTQQHRPNEVNFAKLLLGGAIDINAHDEGGRTLLHSAASAGQVRLVKLLADARADVKAFDNKREKSICLRNGNGHLDSIMALFEHSSDVNLSDPGLVSYKHCYNVKPDRSSAPAVSA